GQVRERHRVQHARSDAGAEQIRLAEAAAREGPPHRDEEQRREQRRDHLVRLSNTPSSLRHTGAKPSISGAPCQHATQSASRTLSGAALSTNGTCSGTTCFPVRKKGAR